MKFKRFLAAALSALMLISCMSFTVSAEGDSTETTEVALEVAESESSSSSEASESDETEEEAEGEATLATETAEEEVTETSTYFTADELKADLAERYGSDYNDYTVVFYDPRELGTDETSGDGTSADSAVIVPLTAKTDLTSALTGENMVIAVMNDASVSGNFHFAVGQKVKNLIITSAKKDSLVTLRSTKIDTNNALANLALLSRARALLLVRMPI